MNSTLAELTQKRAALLVRSQLQREEIAEAFAQLQRPAETTRRVLDSIRSPLVVAGATALLFLLPWRKVLRSPGLLVSGWKIIRVLRKFR